MPRLGYLLPTRERIMDGQPETASLLALAERAEALGFDSVWVGDSLLARPRHDPLTLLAAVAARTRRVELGTAVLLPALRNPVVLAQQVATLDRIAEGRLILGVGIASDGPNIRAEFEAAGVPFDKRVGRMVEGLALCRALWTGKPVDWNGRWKVKSACSARRRIGRAARRSGLAARSPRRANGRAGCSMAGSPTRPASRSIRPMAEVQAAARAAGRDPAALTGAMYLTLAIDEDAARADARINTYLERYYGMRADIMRKRQMCYAGPAAGAAAWLKAYAEAGASHLVLRFAGDPERQLETAAQMRQKLGW